MQVTVPQKWMKLWFLFAMSLRRLLQKNRNAKAARSPLENDRPPSYTSNVTIHTDGANSPNDRIRARHVSLPGRDSVLPDETESSLTNTLGVADTSVVATPRYSKRPSGYPPLPLILMILLVYYHQKKCHLHIYPPEFKIYVQKCVYRPEFHVKVPIILAC